MRRRPYGGLLAGLALATGVACEAPVAGPFCTEYEPPVLLRFVLRSDTLWVTDTVPADWSEWPSLVYDTLRVDWDFERRAPWPAAILTARTPVGGASTLIGQSSGFALRADDDPEGGYRLPGAGVYAIASLELEYTTRACTDYYGNTTATYAKTTVTVAELRTVGLDRDTFVVEHRVQDAIPPLRDR